MINQEIWQIILKIESLETLPSKMFYYKEHFMHFSTLGFIIQPKYLDMLLPHGLRVAIG